MPSRSTAIALFYLAITTSIEFFYTIKTQLIAMFFFALQNDKATVVYFQIFGVAILYILLIAGFFYSAVGMLRQKRYGRRLGLVLSSLNLVIMFSAEYSHWEAGMFDIIEIVISAFIIFSIIMLATSKQHRLG